MELERCLDLGGGVSAPPIRDEPEVEWVKARDGGTIPPELYELYRSTWYLSATAIAGFETEEQRLISAYFTRVTRGVLHCLDEAEVLVRDGSDQLSRLYTPLKKIRGEQWDADAGRQFRATFRLLLIDLVGALDATAELVALVTPDAVSGLHLGRGSFAAMRSWARKPLQSATGLVTPSQHYAERLHRALTMHAVSLRPEEDWFELLRIYRNKVTHLGHQSWLNLGLQADDGEIYYFLPRTWPFIPERYEQTGSRAAHSGPSLAKHLRESLVDVDMITFLNELLAKVNATVGGIAAVLTDVYKETGQLDASKLAPRLDNATETCLFRGFSGASA